jgi:hypothetical protein
MTTALWIAQGFAALVVLALVCVGIAAGRFHFGA